MSLPVVHLARRAQSDRSLAGRRIALLRPPFFTPWSPPLGIALLKGYVERLGATATCFDFNSDSKLWSTHHRYFAALQKLETVTINDGYSKLWFILNGHTLARVNGARTDACARLLQQLAPFYSIHIDPTVADALVEILDSYFRRLDEMLARIDFSSFDVVGTSTYSTSLGSSLHILRRIKERHPRIKTVMGGGVFFDDLAYGSENLETLLRDYPFVDHVVLGEGELLFSRLLQGSFGDRRMVTIADLGAESLDFRDVPTPDFSDLDLEKYFHLTIEGGRSCPFECTFCSETVQWGSYRKKPRERLVDQVTELASRYGNNKFFMGDSLMNPYIADFSSELLSRNASVLYDGYLRADKIVTHRDRVDSWARSGFYRARLGVESASARMLEAMDKMTTPNVISGALKTLAGAGVRTTTYWIVGYPGESEADFEETLEFIREHRDSIYELEAHPYYYYPYGQVSSRQFESVSLYSDEVDSLLRFKQWEVVACSPSREEKFERLRRISQFGSDLGIPNIYSMAERYTAEERWRALHRHVLDVY